MFKQDHANHFYRLFPERFRLWAVSALICLLAAGCNPTENPTPTKTAPSIEVGAGSCHIKIGVITSLSGEYQNRAVELVRGYDMARDEINATGGILNCPLDLVYRDDTSLSSQAEIGMKDLVETEKVLLVVGSFASVITLDLVPLSSQYQIPLLAHNSTNFLITDLRYEWVFRTMPSSWNSMDQMLLHVSHLLMDEFPSVALLYEDSAYGQDIYVSLLSRLKAYDLSLVAALPIPAGAADYGPLLQRVQESEADVLFLAGNSVSDGLRIMEQIEALNLNFNIYMTNGGAFTSAEFTNSRYANYFIAPVPWVSTMPLNDEMSGQTTQDFITRFKERYGVDPGHRTVNAYVNIYIAKTAIEQALSAEADYRLEDARLAIRDALRNLNVKNTLFGPIHFNEFGQNAAQILLVQSLDGKFEVISADVQGAIDAIVPAPHWDEREKP